MPPFDDLEFDVDENFGLKPLRLGKKPRVPSLTEPYDQETQDSLLDNMLGKSMGFLQYLGETLDKPGRAVRGVLAGKPGELANLIPFSDTIGLTDPQKSVSGRDLLEQYGALAPNTPGLDWGDAAGFAAEVLLDPTSYVGLGGLTAAGRTAQAEARLTKGLGAGIKAGERGLFNVGLPWQRGVGMGTGELSERIANTAAGLPGAVGEFATEHIPLGAPVVRGIKKAGREARRLFDNSVGGTGTEIGQRTYARDVPGETYRRTIDTTQPVLKDIFDLSDAGKLEDPDYVRAMRDGLENLRAPGEYAAMGKTDLEEAVGYGRKIKPAYEKFVAEARKLGLHDELQDEAIDYGARYHHPDQLPGMFKAFTDALKQKGALFGEKGRIKFLKGLPGGTNQINDFFKDPALWDLPTTKLAAEKLMLDHGVPEMDQAIDIARWVRHQDKNVYHVQADELIGTKWSGATFFNKDPLSDMIIKAPRHAKQMSEAQWAHGLIQSVGRQLSDDEAAIARHSGDMIQVKQLFEQMGLKSFKKKIEGVAEPLRYGAMPYLASQLKLDVAKPFKALRNYYVPRDVANDILKVAERWQAPETLKATVALYDAGLNLFKGASTQIWPAFHSRNFLSGMYYNVVSGAFDPSFTSLKAAYDLRAGKDISPEVLAKLGFKSQNELLAELQATGVLKQFGNQTMDYVGAGAPAIGPVQATKGVPSEPTNPLKALKDNVSQIPAAFQQGTTPLGKIGNALDATMNVGRKAGNSTEDILRINQYLGRRLQGWTPEAASLDVAKWLFDYGDVSKFEKNVMKRAVPFWTFLRKNTPMVLSELAKNPGGALGQSIRAANMGRQDSGFIPSHIGEGLAIPWPGNPDRFVSGLGLPFENLLPVKIGQSIDQTIGRTLESTISNLTPAITTPYSLASSRDPFFGRPQSELYPFPFSKSVPGNQTLNSLAYKMVGRPITELRRFGDDRKSIPVKAANLFTGVKITDLSGGIERQKALEASRILKEELDEAPGVKSTEHFYLDPADKGKPADSEAIKLLKLKRGLEKQGKAQSKNRSPYEQILLGNL